MHRHRVVGGLALACVVCLAGCKTSTAPAVPCVDPVAVFTIGSGTTPTFTWEPACTAHEIVVMDSVANLMWDVRSDSGSTIASGVTYGVIPPGPHTQTQAPVALVAGKSYAAGLYRNYFSSPTPTDVIAAKAFRP